MPAIEGLAAAGVPISADTFSVEVARRALAAGAVAVNDISGGSDEMFELVAESGCGYVLMHIEGPPRVDRVAPEYDDVVDHLRSWFGGRVERARSLGVGEEQIAIDPGLDFDLSTEQDLEILRRLGELRELGLPLYVSLSRKDFIGAVLGGSWEERLPAADREWGTVAAVALAVRGWRRHPPHPRPQLPAGGQGRECDPGRRMTPSRSLLETPWAIAIDPARRDGRIVAESDEAERPSKTVAMPGSLDPGLVEALGRAGIERLYSHQLEALEAAAASNLVITSGTASGKSLAFNLPVLDDIARDPKRRALYLYPTKALAQDQARKLAELRPPGLREAIYDGDTPREERPAIRRRNNLVLTNPDMLHVGLLPNHRSWGDFLANLGWVVVDEAHTYRGVFGSHVANVLRRLRRIARAYGSEPRFLLASATIANPVELAERLVGTPFAAIDDDGAPSTGREIAMWNPPLIDKATGTRRSALSEAADLLVELVSQGVRTICFLKSRRGIELIQRFAREGLDARAASPSWPSGSRPTGAATRPSSGARSRPGSAPASCSRWSRPTRSSSGSTSASSTRRSASPSPGRSRACARCGGGPAAAVAGSPSTSPVRTRSTSSSAATPTSSSTARSRPRSSTTKASRSPPATCSPPPTSCR